MLIIDDNPSVVISLMLFIFLMLLLMFLFGLLLLLCTSLLDGLLSLYIVCIYVDDVDNVDTVALFTFAAVDVQGACVVASLVRVVSSLWMPRLKMYALCLMLFPLVAC